MNIVGLDLGQTNDPSSICFLQRQDAPIVQAEARKKAPIRCLRTKNPVGTDTWDIGYECPCPNCRAYLKARREHTDDQIKPVNPQNKQYQIPDGTNFSKKLNPYLAGDPAFDLPEDKKENLKQPAIKKNYVCRDIRRWPLGTSYVDIVRDVTRLCSNPIIQTAKTALVVDGTGVGRPIVDMFRAVRPRLGVVKEGDKAVWIVPITITGGKNIILPDEEQKRYIHVPKAELIFSLEIALETGRIGFPRELKEVAVLHNEMRDFKIRKTVKANETFGADVGKHDDLVLAVALAIWFGDRAQQRANIW